MAVRAEIRRPGFAERRRGVGVRWRVGRGNVGSCLGVWFLLVVCAFRRGCQRLVGKTDVGGVVSFCDLCNVIVDLYYYSFADL